MTLSDPLPDFDTAHAKGQRHKQSGKGSQLVPPDGVEQVAQVEHVAVVGSGAAELGGPGGRGGVQQGGAVEDEPGEQGERDEAACDGAEEGVEGVEEGGDERAGDVVDGERGRRWGGVGVRRLGVGVGVGVDVGVEVAVHTTTTTCAHDGHGGVSGRAQRHGDRDREGDGDGDGDGEGEGDGCGPVGGTHCGVGVGWSG
ncbi:hypothetical protein HDU93_003815 [Gonapodya sp. JEL0774]|nr:hypothetical protein HDU93_003815 [Gonapodya sp. JEL0774]